MKPSVGLVGIGNDLMGDDAVGVLAARRLKHIPNIEVSESNGAGLDLLDLMENRDCVLLLDGIHTDGHATGTILLLKPEDLPTVQPVSPHWVSLPEMLAVGRLLGLHLPRTVVLLAMEVDKAFRIGAGLTPGVAAALDGYVRAAEKVLTGWLESEGSCIPAPAVSEEP